MSEGEGPNGGIDAELSRQADYLDHIRQAALDACHFVQGMSKQDFLVDKRTQQAVIMSLIMARPRRS
jgi:uncharacterized protein with HEPN domain